MTLHLANPKTRICICIYNSCVVNTVCCVVHSETVGNTKLHDIVLLHNVALNEDKRIHSFKNKE